MALADKRLYSLIRSVRFRRRGAVNQFGSRQIEAGGHRDSVFSSNSQNSLRPVLHHFRQLSSIDVVEIPEDVYMLRCSGMIPNE